MKRNVGISCKKGVAGRRMYKKVNYMPENLQDWTYKMHAFMSATANNPMRQFMILMYAYKVCNWS